MIRSPIKVEPFRNSRGKSRIRLVSGPLTTVWRGHVYTVPKGYVSDGASIPRLAWPVIGHPFDPAFLRAALFHDIRCEFQIGTSESTHAMFAAMLRQDGVSDRRVRWMLRAVSWFGPRWPGCPLPPAEFAVIAGSRTWGDYDG